MVVPDAWGHLTVAAVGGGAAAATATATAPVEVGQPAYDLASAPYLSPMTLVGSQIAHGGARRRGGTWWRAGVGVGDDVGDGMWCTCALPNAAAPLEARKAPAQGAAAMTQARGSPTSKLGSFPPPAGQRVGYGTLSPYLATQRLGGRWGPNLRGLGP